MVPHPLASPSSAHSSSFLKTSHSNSSESCLVHGSIWARNWGLQGGGGGEEERVLDTESYHNKQEVRPDKQCQANLHMLAVALFKIFFLD